MNARLLDVLHDCTDHGRFAVRNAIDIDLNRIFKKTIDQHWTIRRYLNGAGHITPKILLIIDKLHGAPAENEARPNKCWIANFPGYRDGVFGARGRSIWGLAQTKLVEHGREQASVFCGLNAFGLSAKNGYACRLQSVRQIQRCLTAKLNEYALWFLLIINVEHIFERERLEVKFVARVVIRGDRFWIGVDHDGFKSELAQSKGRVHAAIVEFDSLADPVRAAAKDHNPAFAALAPLVLIAIRRVVIRRVRFKLRRACIDEPIGRQDA